MCSPCLPTARHRAPRSSFWERTLTDDEQRLDRSWFVNTFCGGSVPPAEALKTPGAIWPHVTSLAMARPLALLTAHPGALHAFFDVEVKLVGEVEHVVVGVGAVGGAVEASGVREAHQLRAFLMDALRYALLDSREHAIGLCESGV